MDAVKILVVDDEARMRKLVKDFLSIKGYRVMEAENGEDAVEKFMANRDIKLILLAKDGRVGDFAYYSGKFKCANYHADSKK